MVLIIQYREQRTSLAEWNLSIRVGGRDIQVPRSQAVRRSLGDSGAQDCSGSRWEPLRARPRMALLEDILAQPYVGRPGPSLGPFRAHAGEAGPRQRCGVGWIDFKVRRAWTLTCAGHLSGSVTSGGFLTLCESRPPPQ